MVWTEGEEHLQTFLHHLNHPAFQNQIYADLSAIFKTRPSHAPNIQILHTKVFPS